MKTITREHAGRPLATMAVLIAGLILTFAPSVHAAGQCQPTTTNGGPPCFEKAGAQCFFGNLPSTCVASPNNSNCTCAVVTAGSCQNANPDGGTGPTVVAGTDVLMNQGVIFNDTIRIPDSDPEPCVQFEITGAQWAQTGNVRLMEPDDAGGDSGIVSDYLQLSNDVPDNIAVITAISDSDDGGAADPSVLPNQDAGDLPGVSPIENPNGSTGRILLGQILNVTLPDGGVVGVRTTVFIKSDGDPDGGTTIGSSDTVGFVPAAPPVAMLGLALILMGGGAYMVRRQRMNRG